MRSPDSHSGLEESAHDGKLIWRSGWVRALRFGSLCVVQVFSELKKDLFVHISLVLSSPLQSNHGSDPPN